jgi:hypothetical protein
MALFSTCKVIAGHGIVQCGSTRKDWSIAPQDDAKAFSLDHPKEDGTHGTCANLTYKGGLSHATVRLKMIFGDAVSPELLTVIIVNNLVAFVAPRDIRKTFIERVRRLHNQSLQLTRDWEEFMNELELSADVDDVDITKKDNGEPLHYRKAGER